MRSNSSAKPQQPTQLIYAGGTFGCYGKPLAPLAADVFIPELNKILDAQQLTAVEWLANPLIKDSSQLTPADFVHFYQLIVDAYAQQKNNFVLITGTDTLSYLGAFLAEAFAGSDICLVLTGSMSPLFDASCLSHLQLDQHSDAWRNLTDAIGLASHGEAGVRVCFSGESWHAQTVQKIHSHDSMAFTGHRRAAYPANSYNKQLTKLRRQHWLEDHQQFSKQLMSQAQLSSVIPLYCLPNHQEVLEQQLSYWISKPPRALILIGFGAGNIPYSTTLATLLDQAYQKGHLLVCASQCPYGGVSDDYAAGSWQYQHHVLSAGRLTLAAVYARLLWLQLRYDTPSRRRQRWTYMIKQNQLAKS